MKVAQESAEPFVKFDGGTLALSGLTTRLGNLAQPALACSGRCEAIWDDVGLKESSRAGNFHQISLD